MFRPLRTRNAIRARRRSASFAPELRALEDRTLPNAASFIRSLGTATRADGGPPIAIPVVPGNVRTAIFSAIGIPALPGGTIITINSPSTPSAVASLAEFRGLSSVNTLDAMASKVGATLAVTSGPATTHRPKELLVGAVGVAGTITGFNPNLGFTPGPGYSALVGAYPTAGASMQKVAVHPEYRFVSAAGSYAADGFLASTASGPRAADLATYRVDTADHFAISAPASISAGEPFTVTVTAADATDAGYVGKVRFSTTDPMGAILESVTLMPGDHGVKTIPVTLFSDGLRKIVAVDATGPVTIAGSTPVFVHTHHLDVTPTPVPIGVGGIVEPEMIAGDPFSFTVTARRYDGSVDTTYISTLGFVLFTVDALDAYGNGLLWYTGPAHFEFSGAGVKVFDDSSILGFYLGVAGFQSTGTLFINVNDIADPTIVGSTTVEIISPPENLRGQRPRIS